MSFSRQTGSNRKTGLCKLEACADMSIYTAASCHGSLLSLFPDYTSFELDLSKVDEIDSSGVQLLLAAARQANLSNKQFKLHSASPPVAEVMLLLNLRDRFDWVEATD